jgi:ABC-type uncharacterized transport system auxiliary subunit
MNVDTRRDLKFLALAAFLLTLSACGTRTETEKTTIIERKVETPGQAPASEPESGHLQRAGEKIDAKVDRKIDEAIDSAIGN